ncbi:uncharacterized protein LOC117106431 [Anneissia japonica]|uniref:uncharacterized protein LOC117106431 n=1 Tax=Anneissia japonica TaxID=1529436 RepID=UPI001425A385|nr:uncharacterized protein LOC117106431 [Anneissia japonica]XP_033103691.1 uncharacterized protein LOC117106431 [Anneissia japonica]XP_033103692.1 uncharacterized protein LOC117106431 [Anneissia japonica]
MNKDDLHKLLEKNKKLQEENEKLKKTSEGVHSISKAFAESNREKEKLKDTIRILTHQLSSTSSSSSGTKSIDGSHSPSGAAEPQSQISDNELLDLAGELGNNWRSLAFRLDIQTGEVDAVREQYSSPKQQIYQILKMWRQKRVQTADLRDQLSSALERTGRRDLAEKLQKDVSEHSTLPSTCDLPWFFDIVSLECQGKDEWKTLGSNLKIKPEKLNEIERFPLGERIYGVLDSWLKCLLSGTNPLVVLVMALISSGRNDVAEKLKKASKERNEYIEEWSMQQESMFSEKLKRQKHVRLNSPTISQQSAFSQNNSLEGIESLKNSSVHPPGTDDIYTDDESVKSFRSGESMDMKPESATFDSVMVT